MKREFRGSPETYSQKGIKNDPSNVCETIPVRLRRWMCWENLRQSEVKALELYPDLDRMPTSLVYELALNRAEEGEL